MADAGTEFTTRLTLDECKQVFRLASEGSRGMSAKLGGFAAKVAGNSQGGFYTPEMGASFGLHELGYPDYGVGVWIERFSSGAKGAGYSVQMYVWDRGNHRRVNLNAPGGVTSVYKPRKLISRFAGAFQQADPAIQFSDP